MHIKKIGHCCLVIEIDGVRIMADPGSYTVDAHKEVKGIDAIFITHEHQDHLHIDSIAEILKNNPGTRVITNSAVGKLFGAAGIAHEIVEERGTGAVKNLAIEAFDAKHEEIFEEIGQVQNTGYWIGPKLFYPGDAYADPGKPVDVLAMPVSGPWCKLPDAIRYALKIKPRAAFPVHDGNHRPGNAGFTHRILKQVLEQRGIAFTPMIEGDEAEF
jgi:L-ascorbate metabolism protein UlaG (beta-lactamase superfamily)